MKTEPGPGLYNPEKPKTDIQYSMRKKYGPSGAPGNPGPGTYGDERELHYRTIPGSKMGKDTRLSNHFIHTPSYNKQEPGRYDLHDFANNELMGVPKYSFGKQKRAPNKGGLEPGPTSYKIASKMTDGVPCYSMPGRRKDLRPKVGVGVPGSGSYDPSNTFTKKNGPLFSVSRQRRDGEVNIYKNTPGAGTYHDVAS